MDACSLSQPLAPRCRCLTGSCHMAHQAAAGLHACLPWQPRSGGEERCLARQWGSAAALPEGLSAGAWQAVLAVAQAEPQVLIACQAVRGAQTKQQSPCLCQTLPAAALQRPLLQIAASQRMAAVPCWLQLSRLPPVSVVCTQQHNCHAYGTSERALDHALGNLKIGSTRYALWLA